MSESQAVADVASDSPPLEKRRVEYNDWVVRWFITASMLWGIVGMLVGVIVALQMAWWPANVAFLTFGRLRPLHTNAVIFAFVGNMMFAGVYHSTQRLVKARLGSDLLSKVHFWGWQLIIVSAAVTLPLGISAGKEYAELEWPIDIAIALVWVVFAINFFWTLKNRAEKHLYVAIWFYIATIITVAVLHIVNSLAIPVGPLKSYSIFGGAQDALVQWWYGHNAVAFFLTTPILGIMYYYMPKATGRPVYSYRLSIIHFWALIFLYIWAGPHHLLNTSLPEWAQTLGMVFSVMLWAPSWGGMINGLLTLRGAWEKLRVDPVIKFFAAGVTFYGMATFEGPLLSVKSVNALAKFSDWIIGHVHSGALGWNGLMAAGMFYFLVPRLWGTKLWSTRLANMHFYLATFGILLYMGSMWVSGVDQGLMWRATDATGALKYPNFLETLQSVRPMYWFRLVGGTMYLVGMILMAVNLFKTMGSGKHVVASVDVVVPRKDPTEPSWAAVFFGKPILVSTLVIALVVVMAFVNSSASVFLAVTAFVAALLGGVALKLSAKDGKPTWHRLVEGRALVFTVLSVFAVLVGGVAEIVPAVVVGNGGDPKSATKQPYTALELEGRDIYIREGCYNCHSQMIRTLRWEAQRYGDPSTLADSQYDHPFQWGSKRTGPDLARVGAKYSGVDGAVWHYRHMIDPREISPGSNMPPYPYLAAGKLDFSMTEAKVRAMRSIGVPYKPEQITSATADAKAQAQAIVVGLKSKNVDLAPDAELVALIAYLQRLGVEPKAAAAGGAGVSMAAPAKEGAAQ